jgi:hypothetical protein
MIAIGLVKILGVIARSEGTGGADGSGSNVVRG